MSVPDGTLSAATTRASAPGSVDGGAKTTWPSPSRVARSTGAPANSDAGSSSGAANTSTGSA